MILAVFIVPKTNRTFIFRFFPTELNRDVIPASHCTTHDEALLFSDYETVPFSASVFKMGSKVHVSAVRLPTLSKNRPFAFKFAHCRQRIRSLEATCHDDHQRLRRGTGNGI